LVHTPDIQFPHQGGDLIAIVKRDESENWLYNNGTSL
jgi:hypothetical protein